MSLIKIKDFNNKYISNATTTQLDNPKFNKTKDIPVKISNDPNSFIITKKEHGKY